MQPSPAWLVCPRVAEDLDDLEGELHSAAATVDSAGDAITQHLIHMGGKRLRPTLLLLAAQFGPAPCGELKRAAVAMEFLHVASLYHDDVMDRARMRRGAPSANALWGNLLAVCGGTFLFARATQILTALGDEPNRMASEASVRLCTGQLQEAENVYNLDLTEEDHLVILEKKTATLFELPCQLGSWLSGSSERIRAALLEFARALGLAFQLADDVLDLTADPFNIGKPTLTDLREGVYSYPVILALRKGGAEGQLGEALRKTYLTDEELHTAAGLVQQSGAIDAALSKAQDLAAQAKAALAELPALAARESLSRLADFAVCRTH